MCHMVNKEFRNEEQEYGAAENKSVANINDRYTINYEAVEYWVNICVECLALLHKSYGIIMRQFWHTLLDPTGCHTCGFVKAMPLLCLYNKAIMCPQTICNALTMQRTDK